MLRIKPFHIHINRLMGQDSWEGRRFKDQISDHQLIKDCQCIIAQPSFQIDQIKYVALSSGIFLGLKTWVQALQCKHLLYHESQEPFDQIVLVNPMFRERINNLQGTSYTSDTNFRQENVCLPISTFKENDWSSAKVSIMTRIPLYTLTQPTWDHSLPCHLLKWHTHTPLPCPSLFDIDNISD